MQQEYTPYGPEWAKEIKKLTKDQIIDNLLRPALMKAKAEPGGRSAGTWVKASQLPPNDMADDFPKKYITRCKDDGWRGQALVYSLNYEEIKMANTQYDYAEWLDEAALPDNKDREEQAEWEFVQILKENYEAAKRSGEYHFAGKTKKEAVVETYEDLFEIIKGLPLKRQKVDFSFLNDNKERERAIGILKTLCGLKQYKDAKGKDEYYEQQKELAWKEAFDFLKKNKL